MFDIADKSPDYFKNYRLVWLHIEFWWFGLSTLLAYITHQFI